MARKPRDCFIPHQLGKQSNKSTTSAAWHGAINSHSSSSVSTEDRCKHHQQQNHRRERQELRLQPLAAQMPPTIRGITIKKEAFTDNFQAFTTTLGHHKYPFRSSVVAWPPLMNSAGILAVGVHERFPSTHCGQQQETPKCCHPKSHGQADAFVQHESMARDFTTSQRVLRSKGLGRLFAPVEPRRELSFQLAITLSTEPSAES